MNCNIDVIRAKYHSGEPLSFVFFWGHTCIPGSITHACLSQWYPCTFVVDGICYHTAEQYMMAQKSLLFQDQASRDKIMAADDPRDYKALGRQIRDFDQQIWDLHKYEIVLQGNLAKFMQNPPLRQFLLDTRECVLVEASPHDTVWGVGLASNDPAIQNPDHWKGENLLGFALMETRSLLMEDHGTVFGS